MFDSLTKDELAELHLVLYRATENTSRLAQYVSHIAGGQRNPVWLQIREQGAESNMLCREVVDELQRRSIRRVALACQ